MFVRSLGAFCDQLRGLRGEGRGTILLAIALGWGLTVGARTIFPALLPQLRAAYGLDLTLAGLLLTVLFVAYALGQLPGGVLADRIGERLTLTGSVAVSAIAVVAVVVSRSALALFAATAVFGFAIGFYAIARFTAIAAVYPEEHGTAVGVTNAAPEIGQAVCPPIAGLLAVLAGWQLGFGFVVPAFVLVAAALWLTVPSRDVGAHAGVSGRDLRRIAAALRRPRVVRGTVVMILGIAVWQAFTGFYPTYLIERKGLSPAVASALFGLYFLSTALVHPLSGAIYDRSTVRRPFAMVLVSVATLAALPAIEGIVGLAVASVLLGTLLGFETSTESYLVASLPADVAGTGFGILRTAVFAGGAASPLIFGAVADRGFFDGLFLAMAAVLAFTVVLATSLPPEG